MQLETIFNMSQIVLSIIVTALIMLQAKSSGLSTVFGGGSFQTTKRGSEKFLYYLTILFVIVFCGLSLARVFV